MLSLVPRGAAGPAVEMNRVKDMPACYEVRPIRMKVCMDIYGAEDKTSTKASRHLK